MGARHVGRTIRRDACELVRIIVRGFDGGAAQREGDQLTLAVHAPVPVSLPDYTDAEVVPPADVDAITVVIRRWWEAYQKGIRPAPLARDDLQTLLL